MIRFLPPKEHDLSFKKTVTLWDEAIPLGAGMTGCLIWGDGEPLKLSLDRGDIWDNRPTPEVLAPDFTYAELIRLVREGRYDEIAPRFECPIFKPTPTKIPAGRLELSFGQAADNVESYLSLARAEAEITLHYGEETASLTSFMHAEKRYGFLRVTGKTPVLRVISHDFTAPEDGSELPSDSIRLLGYPPVEMTEIGRVKIALQRTAEGSAFALMIASHIRNGALEAVYYVAASTEGENWLENAAAMLENALDMGYDAAIAPHLAWWEGFWSKSRISLADKYIEKNWYITNYLLASCSRKNCPPMPLQGVWTADEGTLPPWKGEYAFDTNVQFSYYSYLKSDHLEEGESCLDFLWSLNDKARAFTKKFYDADGICLPTSMSFDCNSLGGWPQCSYSLSNHIWTTHLFYQYYRYTADETFLQDRLYPYLKYAEAVVRRHFVRDEQGLLTLPISSSPELHDNRPEAWMNPISNYDLSALHFLYDALIELAPAVCADDLPLWQETRAQLPALAVDEHKGYMIKPGENLDESHRHFSHLMAIFPYEQCRYNRSEAEKELIDKSVHNLEVLGRGLWVGFSFTWMAEIYAKMGNGAAAAYQLKSFFEHLCGPNGFHLNGDFRHTGITQFHYRPFTLESNMCAADAIQEMLMQCYEGAIRLFPALPKDWKESGCEFEGFLSFGGVKVSSAIRDEKVSFVRLNPKKDAVASVYNPFASDTVKVTSSEGEYTVTAAPGEAFTLSLKAGVEYTLTA